MTVSVVLRLREQELCGGGLVGQAELVERGERSAIGSADELVAFLNGTTAEGERPLASGLRQPRSPGKES